MEATHGVNSMVTEEYKAWLAGQLAKQRAKAAQELSTESEPPQLVDVQEYLRRNQLVAKAHGAHANACELLKRVRLGRRPSKRLMADLEGIIERLEPLAYELALHRDEIGVIR